MGIKHFWKFFRGMFGDCITNFNKKQNFGEIKVNIDNLLLDLNGIFHPCAQKVYKYGNHKQPVSLLRPGNRNRNGGGGHRKQVLVFQEVCKEIEMLIRITQPKKRVVLCVDGVAPVCKQSQQKSRRYRTALERDDEGFNEFDSNCISPGTKFMDNLTKYIDWYIKKKISTDKVWQGLEIVFSNEKVPGEGEHTAIQFIRFYGGMDESYCICGMDADLIMLTLGTQAPNFWILRDDIYSRDNDYFVINIGKTRKKLVRYLDWTEWSQDEEKENKIKLKKDVSCLQKYKSTTAVNDFIFLCFCVGNDFLPHIPSLEIMQRGIECMLDVYTEIGKTYGHLTKTMRDKVVFSRKSLKIFFGTIAGYEKEMFVNKLRRKGDFLPDPILEESEEIVNGDISMDLEKYKRSYYRINLGINYDNEEELKKFCFEYLEGLQWVITYYIQGVPDWNWFFHHLYSPFCSDLVKFVEEFEYPDYSFSKPLPPFMQLLSILPPKSYKLIPHPLSNLLINKKSPLRKFCPELFKIDYAGKRMKWEGIPILPFPDFKVIEEEYYKELDKVDPKELKRNKMGKCFVYNYDSDISFFVKSYYGDLRSCKVNIYTLEL